MPPRRRALLLLLLAPLLLGVAGSPSRAAAAYAWPVDGQPVVDFDGPDRPWDAGHRGIDLVAPHGASVGAMADGRVVFAGTVAGAQWVTTRHPDGVRTSVGPLLDVAVGVGDAVRAGDRLGRSAGAAHRAGDGLLHVGARRGEAYLDPRRLVAPHVPTLVGGGEVDGPGVGPVAGPPPTLVPGAPPSPRRLVVVGGLGSSTDRPPLDPARLGYHGDDVEHLSYAGLRDGRPRPHDAADTWQHVHDAALLLDAQLRAAQARHPGRGVDLVGHSLGGLVAIYHLLVVHDPTDPGLPPIGRVVTVASPLDGADLADVVRRTWTDPVLHALVRLADALHDPLSLDAPVLDDLAPGSEVVRAVRGAWDRARADPFGGPLGTGTDVLAVGALLDPVVPAHRSDVDGMRTRTVLDTHGGAPRSDTTTDLVRAFLAGRPLPVPTTGERVASALRPATVLVGVAERLLSLPG